MSELDAALLTTSELPYGMPDWTSFGAADYLPAIRTAFAAHRAEVEQIAANPEAPTFDNTLTALERAGEPLERVLHAFFTVSGADATPQIQQIEAELAPELAAHEDAITLDPRLHARVAAVHAQLDELELTPEQRYLVERRLRTMTLAGAGLDDAARARLTELNQALSSLSTQFDKNLLTESNELAVHFTAAAELDGLTEGELSAVAGAAADRGLDGWLVTLPLFTGHPYLASLTNRESRRRIMQASQQRGRRGNQSDQAQVVREIVRLRAERAALLGAASHADHIISDQTIGSVEKVKELLFTLAAPAARNARAEAAALQQLINDTEPEPFELAAHDWAYYTEKLRSAHHDVDTAALRPWFEAERVLIDGVFFAATRLYGVTFTERSDIPSYHSGARVFEVRNEDGSPLGLYVLDLYTRDTKRGGAWMNPIMPQSALRGTRPIVVNNLNVSKPAQGPTLLTFDEVNTLFHEFGHALHGLFAEVTYPTFAGTNVFRDFVEFPSQVNEMWILDPAVLANYARHHETGEPLDSAVVQRIRGLEAFNQGFLTSEYLAASWLDQTWHRLSPEQAGAIEDVAAFEAAALAEIGLDDPVVPTRYSTTWFQHIFSSGYSAGYYSYIWSEVLDADAVEWFKAHGGLTRANGDLFRERLLGVGGSKDPLAAYRDFTGHDADLQPLLTRRGLDA